MELRLSVLRNLSSEKNSTALTVAWRVFCSIDRFNYCFLHYSANYNLKKMKVADVVTGALSCVWNSTFCVITLLCMYIGINPWEQARNQRGAGRRNLPRKMCWT